MLVGISCEDLIMECELLFHDFFQFLNELLTKEKYLYLTFFCLFVKFCFNEKMGEVKKKMMFFASWSMNLHLMLVYKPFKLFIFYY